MKDVKKWTAVFRVLANVNRLKTIDMLAKKKGIEMTVGDIAEALEISFKATSNHLAILKTSNVVDARGSSGHVFYSINQKIPKEFRSVLDLVK